MQTVTFRHGFRKTVIQLRRSFIKRIATSERRARVRGLTGREKVSILHREGRIGGPVGLLLRCHKKGVWGGKGKEINNKQKR